MQSDCALSGDDAIEIVIGSSDAETGELLAQWRRQHPGQPCRTVFLEQDLADLYARDPLVTATAWGPALARRVTDQFPPAPLGRVAPPPVVVGDGDLARHVTRALLEGWSEPGWPLIVHCIGQEPGWARDAREEAGREGRVTWTEVSGRPIPVAIRVGELVEMWDAPPDEKGTATGPTVIVATAAPDSTLTIASAIARRHPKARVAAIIDGHAARWPSPEAVTVFSVTQAIQLAATTDSDASVRLRELLLADTAWMNAPEAAATRPEEPIFDDVINQPGTTSPVPYAEQPEMLRRQLGSVAAACETILASAGLELSGEGAGDVGIILTPGELSAMAREIQRAVGCKESDGTRLTALELAFQLPRLARRAGLAVNRPVGQAPLLSLETAELLAPMVHLAYQDVSSETGNATGSSVAYEMWEELSDFLKASNRGVVVGSAVAHAAVGLDWRSTRSGGSAPVDLPIGRLAELEHRRWALFQRLNGANDHKWMEPWKDVPERTRRYDFHIMAQLPYILAEGGVEVFRAGSSGLLDPSVKKERKGGNP